MQQQIRLIQCIRSLTEEGGGYKSTLSRNWIDKKKFQYKQQNI